MIKRFLKWLFDRGIPDYELESCKADLYECSETLLLRNDKITQLNAVIVSLDRNIGLYKAEKMKLAAELLNARNELDNKKRELDAVLKRNEILEEEVTLLSKANARIINNTAYEGVSTNG